MLEADGFGPEIRLDPCIHAGLGFRVGFRLQLLKTCEVFRLRVQGLHELAVLGFLGPPPLLRLSHIYPVPKNSRNKWHLLIAM